jgi:RNA polymerase sigma-70 factor, ECF subfamily
MQMQFRSFDADYIQRLLARDADVENHFAAYFGELIEIKLRCRVRSRDQLDDLKQETLVRVLENLRKNGGVEHPERFGAFVNAVCNYVLMESYRAAKRNQPLGEAQERLPDLNIDLDASLVDGDKKKLVADILAKLSEQDRELLRAVFLQQIDRTEISARFNVDGGYLRVMVHRAKERFRKALEASARKK